MKTLMSGNEAAARGAYEAGARVCAAYPGTPSTEIFENLPQYKDALYCEWAPNEKVATEVAYGASMAGVRSLCAMVSRQEREMSSNSTIWGRYPVLTVGPR